MIRRGAWEDNKVEVEHKWNTKITIYLMGHIAGDVVFCKPERNAFRTGQVKSRRPNTGCGNRPT